MEQDIAEMFAKMNICRRRRWVQPAGDVRAREVRDVVFLQTSDGCAEILVLKKKRAEATVKLHRYSGRMVVLARYQDLCRRDVHSLCNGLYYFIEDNLFNIHDNPQIIVNYLQ